MTARRIPHARPARPGAVDRTCAALLRAPVLAFALAIVGATLATVALYGALVYALVTL